MFFRKTLKYDYYDSTSVIPMWKSTICSRSFGNLSRRIWTVKSGSVFCLLRLFQAVAIHWDHHPLNSRKEQGESLGDTIFEPFFRCMQTPLMKLCIANVWSKRNEWFTSANYFYKGEIVFENQAAKLLLLYLTLLLQWTFLEETLVVGGKTTFSLLENNQATVIKHTFLFHVISGRQKKD